MKRSEVFFGLLRIPVDALAVLGALSMSYQLRLANMDLIPGVQLLEPALTLPPFDTYITSFIFPSVLTLIVIAALLHLYNLRTTRSAWNEAGRIVVAGLLWLVCVMAWYFLVRKELFYSRVLLIHSALFLILAVGIGRTIVLSLQRTFLRFGVGVRLVISVGKQPLATLVCRTLEHDMHYRYLGHIDGIASLVFEEKEQHIDLVLQTDPHPTSEETIALINFCRSSHIGYGFLPPVLADVPHQLTVQRLGLMPLIRFQPTPLDGWGRVFKRVFDLSVSILLLLVLIPLLLVLVLFILILDGWPILYVSTRIGGEGRVTIPMLKFRTMVRGADAMRIELTQQSHRRDGPLFKVKNDPRVTRLGHILRRFSLDELPQLLNVLVGQMSLVGPRPHLPEEVRRYTEIERRVFAVKPGITGLSQVSGRSDLTFEQEVKCDLQYIEEWSILLDLWILWRSLFVIVQERGAD